MSRCDDCGKDFHPSLLTDVVRNLHHTTKYHKLCPKCFKED